MAITAFLSRSPGLLNRRPTLLGAGFLYWILSPTDWTSCAPSYIIVWHPLSSCGRHKSHSFNPSTVKVIFWYSSTGCTCYLHRCISYFDNPAGLEVDIQQKYVNFSNNFRAMPLRVRKYATTITVKLIYAPNKNTKFFLLQVYGLFGLSCWWHFDIADSSRKGSWWKKPTDFREKYNVPLKL